MDKLRQDVLRIMKDEIESSGGFLGMAQRAGCMCDEEGGQLYLGSGTEKPKQKRQPSLRNKLVSHLMKHEGVSIGEASKYIKALTEKGHTIEQIAKRFKVN